MTLDNESHLMHRIAQMYLKFGYSYMGPPRALSYTDKLDRIKMMQEELDEFETANNLVEEYDALLDLIVFAVGTIEQMGLPLKLGFDAVMDSNMAKEPGMKDSRGIAKDLIKPEGWEGPEKRLREIINNFVSAPEIDMEQLSRPGGDTCMKWDEKKTPLQLVPTEIVNAMAEVYGYGAEKYGPNNWRTGQNMSDFPTVTRVMGSILRHLFAFNYGEDNDQESTLPHLWHAMTQVAILSYYIMYNMNKDDRYVRDSESAADNISDV